MNQHKTPAQRQREAIRKIRNEVAGEYVEKILRSPNMEATVSLDELRNDNDLTGRHADRKDRDRIAYEIIHAIARIFRSKYQMEFLSIDGRGLYGLTGESNARFNLMFIRRYTRMKGEHNGWSRLAREGVEKRFITNTMGVDRLRIPDVTRLLKGE